jgi:tellurite resistance protein TerC
MQTIAPLWLWATFALIVVFSLFIDFVVLRKQGAQDIGVKEALNWSLIWIAVSFL